MTMHSGRTDFNPRTMPLLQDVATLDSAKELLRSTELEDFITVLNFLDPQEATDFAKCIFKCRRHGLVEQERRFWLIAKARVAVKGRRSELFAQVLSRLLVPEFFGGKAVQHGKPSDNGKENV